MSGLQRYRYSLFSIISIVLPLLFVHTSSAQHPKLKFEKLNTENGLSQNQVYAITQDHQGFLWFGTDEGLNRFDGHEFKIFTHSGSDSTTISDNSVHALILADDSILWIGTNGGITLYDSKTETFERLEVNYDDFSKPNGVAVNQMKKDSQGRIWIAYLGSGVDVYDPITKNFLHYTIHNVDGYRIFNDYVIAIQFMPDGSTLFATREGIQVIDSIGFPMTTEKALQKYKWLDRLDPSVKSFCLSGDQQTLYVSTEAAGLQIVNLRTENVTTLNTKNSSLLFNNNIPVVFEDSKNNIWVGGEAIYLLDREKNDVIPYNEEGNQGTVEKKNPILSIFEDTDRNIWFGTFRLGLLKYNPENINIIHYYADESEGGLNNNQILSFNEDLNRNLLVGTDGGGLLKLNPDLKTFQRISSEEWSSQVMKTMHRDESGNLWIGTWDGGMIRYDQRRGATKIFHPDLKNFEPRHVWDIVEDTEGNLWLGTLRDGLIKYTPGSGEFRTFKNDPSDSTSLANNDILSLFIDSDETIWVGSSYGLSILKKGESKFRNIGKIGASISVLCFYEDESKRLWLGTNGSGLFILDKSLKIEKVLTEKDGLLSPTICSIEADDHGSLWVSTYNGLFKINPKTFAINQIPPIAGLQGKEFIPRASFRLSDGRLAFGGVNGFNLFHPDSINFSRKPRETVFTSMRINNVEIKPGKEYNERIVLDNSITGTSSIELRDDDHTLTLTFSSLTFNWQSSLQYAYKLEGFDKEWQTASSDKRLIHYTSLDPGNYTLRLRSSYDGKIWTDHKNVLAIHVLPPWYSTLAFKIAAAMTMAAFFFMLYRVRVNFMKKQQEKLEQLVNVRTRELEQSNVEIQLLLNEVASQKKTIEEQMNELQNVHDEIVAQRDVLALRSDELEKAQLRLKELNNGLEVLVENRTLKLTNALRELETFLYRASHDLRGPISTMLGLLSVARMETDAAKYHSIYNHFLQKTVVTLDRTLQKLLQKHTIEKKRVVIEKIDKNIFQAMLDEILPDVPYYRHEDFVADVQSDLSLQTDKVFLSIILSNLIENAFFYSHMASDRKVILTLTQSEHSVEIVVQDFGAGIKETVQEKIFTMFYRGHETSNGNGLGLYLVKSIVGKLEGEIRVESKEGLYTKFFINLPTCMQFRQKRSVETLT